MSLKKPKVFISYSAASGNHTRWIERDLAARLRNDGADVFFYPWEEHRFFGVPVDEILKEEITQSDFVLMVCTPTYKEKAETIESWAREECNIITKQIYRQGLKGMIIPILRSGKAEDSVPGFISKTERVGWADFTTPSKVDRNYQNLLKKIGLGSIRDDLERESQLQVNGDGSGEVVKDPNTGTTNPQQARKEAERKLARRYQKVQSAIGYAPIGTAIHGLIELVQTTPVLKQAAKRLFVIEDSPSVKEWKRTQQGGWLRPPVQRDKKARLGYEIMTTLYERVGEPNHDFNMGICHYGLKISRQRKFDICASEFVVNFVGPFVDFLDEELET